MSKADRISKRKEKAKVLPKDLSQCEVSRISKLTGLQQVLREGTKLKRCDQSHHI